MKDIIDHYVCYERTNIDRRQGLDQRSNDILYTDAEQ